MLQDMSLWTTQNSYFFMQALKNDIIKMAGEHPEHLEYVLSKFVEQKFKRGEYLFVAGQVCRSVYFVQSGLLQVLYLSSDGVEKTADIVTGNNWFSDIDSFKNGIPSQRRSSQRHRLQRPKRSLLFLYMS